MLRFKGGLNEVHNSRFSFLVFATLHGTWFNGVIFEFKKKKKSIRPNFSYFGEKQYRAGGGQLETDLANSNCRRSDWHHRLDSANSSWIRPRVAESCYPSRIWQNRAEADPATNGGIQLVTA